METGPFSQVKRWLPLIAAGAVIVVGLVAFWVTQPAAAIPVPGDRSESAQAVSPAQPEPERAPLPALITPPGTETAPDFRGIVRWLNSEPLALEEQRGKVVLIDFWTYS